MVFFLVVYVSTSGEVSCTKHNALHEGQTDKLGVSLLSMINLLHKMMDIYLKRKHDRQWHLLITLQNTH